MEVAVEHIRLLSHRAMFQFVPYRDRKAAMERDRGQRRMRLKVVVGSKMMQTQ
jgi:hypothetical protein